MTERPGRYQRTFPGLVGALAVLLLVLLGFVLVRAAIRPDVDNDVDAIDYTEGLDALRAEATFRLLAPDALPEGWKATSARFESRRPQAWHLGVLTDEGDYIGLEQGRESEAMMVKTYVDEEAEQGDAVEAAGETWTSYTDEGGDLALVRRQGGVTTLVVGTVSEDDLVSYVESLR